MACVPTVNTAASEPRRVLVRIVAFHLNLCHDLKPSYTKFVHEITGTEYFDTSQTPTQAVWRAARHRGASSRSFGFTRRFDSFGKGHQKAKLRPASRCPLDLDVALAGQKSNARLASIPPAPARVTSAPSVFAQHTQSCRAHIRPPSLLFGDKVLDVNHRCWAGDSHVIQGYFRPDDGIMGGGSRLRQSGERLGRHDRCLSRTK